MHEIDAEVDWDCELGTVTRRAFGNGDAQALLFNNIKDYRNGRCTKLFTGGLSNYSRVAMMFGLSKKRADHRLGAGRPHGLFGPPSTRSVALVAPPAALSPEAASSPRCAIF